MKGLALLCLLAALACKQSEQHDHSARAFGATAAQSTPAAPANAADEHAELRKLIAKVTPDDRKRVQRERDKLWKAYEAAHIEPRVLFEVPARECCPSPDQACNRRHLRFAGLCYENPTRELWGLGAFAIDDNGVFWIHDAVVDRAVGFDRTGKLVEGVPLDGGPIGPEHLVVTAKEVWLDTLTPHDDPNAAWLTRVDRATFRARDYHWQDLVGKDYEGYGWAMPENPSRVVRWHSRMHWDTVDVSFLDDTRMQISAPHPLHARGHRYWLDCDDEKNPSALVIDDHAVAAPSCVQVQYIGPDGDVVAGDPFYHYDVHGHVLAVASRTSATFDILSNGNDSAVGPDGNAYQYLPGQHSVQVVELPWFSK